jgi:hypothetical protein
MALYISYRNVNAAMNQEKIFLYSLEEVKNRKQDLHGNGWSIAQLYHRNTG